MAYANYEFYKSKYFGTMPEPDFTRMSERATDFIDTMTYDRLVEKLPDNERAKTKIKKAVCSVADELYILEQAEKMALSAVTGNSGTGGASTGIITSRSAGSESVGYASPSDVSGFSATLEASKTKEETDKLLTKTAKGFLSGLTTDSGTPLLYAGMR